MLSDVLYQAMKDIGWYVQHYPQVYQDYEDDITEVFQAIRTLLLKLDTPPPPDCWTCTGCHRTFPVVVNRYAGPLDSEDEFCHRCYMTTFYPQVTHPDSPLRCDACKGWIQPGEPYEELYHCTLCEPCYQARFEEGKEEYIS